MYTRITTTRFIKIDKMGFSYTSLTQEQLKEIGFEYFSQYKCPTIVDLYVKSLKTYIDGRGDLTELWSRPWVDKEPVHNTIEHIYFNTTHEGVVKAWHVHEKTYSQYTCVSGKMQVVLVDVRPDSETFGHVNDFVIGTQNPSYIKIPPGVLKGWKSLHGDSVIVNLLSSADLGDNYKYSWDLILCDVWQPNMG